MPMAWSDELRARAVRDLPRLADRHPDLQVAIDAAYVGTNWTAFGTLRGSAVVVKHFAQRERWLNEVACLRHLAASGTVPRVLDGDCEPFLVAERLVGEDAAAGYRAAHAAGTGLEALSEAIGAALAAVVMTPLPVSGPGYCPVRDFAVIPWSPDPHAMLVRYLQSCQRIVHVLPSYAAGIFATSLALLSAQLPTIGQRRRCLYHEDISNLTINHGRFSGFFDLEMCRLGTDLMQLGIGLQCCGPGRLAWPQFRRAFERGTGQELTCVDLQSAIAMHHFYAWIRICRWGWWDGDPAQVGHRRDAESELAGWRAYLTDGCAEMRREPDLAEALDAAGF
jgi:hypothetical protein